MSRSRSEMYQVDFIAALFGGFLLIWLSGTNEADVPASPTGSVLFFQISVRNLYKGDQGQEALAFLPTDAVATACVDANWLSVIYRNRHELKTCHGSTEFFAGNVHQDYLASVVARAMSEQGKVQHVVGVFSADIQIESAGAGAGPEISWIGRAVAPSGQLPSAGAYSEEGVTVSLASAQVAIASIPRAGMSIPRIQIRNPALSGPVAVDQLQDSPGTRSFYMASYKSRPWPGGYPDLVETQIALVWDLGRRDECWRGSIQPVLDDDLLQDVPLSPC